MNIIRHLRSFLFKLMNALLFNIQGVKLGPGPIFNGVVFIKNKGETLIGANFRATSGSRYNPIGGDTQLRIVCKQHATIRIGDNVGISNSTLHIAQELKVGNNVLIGGGCRIWDSDFHSIDPQKRNFRGDRHVVTAPIVIGDGAFIGAGSIILKGVSIGKNAIVGAGSVVTKSIPQNEVWAGNPAKKIRELANEYN